MWCGGIQVNGISEVPWHSRNGRFRPSGFGLFRPSALGLRASRRDTPQRVKQEAPFIAHCLLYRPRSQRRQPIPPQRRPRTEIHRLVGQRETAGDVRRRGGGMNHFALRPVKRIHRLAGQPHQQPAPMPAQAICVCGPGRLFVRTTCIVCGSNVNRRSPTVVNTLPSAATVAG